MAKDAFDLVLRSEDDQLGASVPASNLSNAIAFLMRGRAKLMIAEHKEFSRNDRGRE